LPALWVNKIRDAFHQKGEPVINAPARVTFQKLSDGSFVIHNYNQETVNITIKPEESGEYIDGFTSQPLPSDGGFIRLTMKARTNIWGLRD
jgi:hypothetical protein